MDGGGGQAVVHEGFKSNIGHFAINDRKTFGQDAIQKFVGAQLSRSHVFGNNLKVQGNFTVYEFSLHSRSMALPQGQKLG